MASKSTDVQKALIDPFKEEESVKSPSSVTKPSTDKKSFEARYAALRNHRIRLEDAIDPDAERVSKIRKDDILFGRGKGFQNHPGNRRMRKIIEKYKVKYHALLRTEKQDLIKAVYNELTESGARFLKRLEKEAVWIMVDRPVALQKVSHTLRCRKGGLERVTNEKVNLSSHEVTGRAAGGISHPPLTSLAGLQSPIRLASSTSVKALPSTNSAFSSLEAQRLAALERFRALTTMPFEKSFPCSSYHCYSLGSLQQFEEGTNDSKIDDPR